MGTRKLKKLVAQDAAVRALPPLVAAAGEWAFRVPGLPVAWNNALIRMAGRRPFLSDKARQWKREIAIEASPRCPPGWQMDAKYEVQILCVFANARADADGPVKLILDALTGIAWRDDRLVSSVTARKEVDAERPRIEVRIQVST